MCLFVLFVLVCSASSKSTKTSGKVPLIAHALSTAVVLKKIKKCKK